jgi:hypothetical protein
MARDRRRSTLASSGATQPPRPSVMRDGLRATCRHTRSHDAKAREAEAGAGENGQIRFRYALYEQQQPDGTSRSPRLPLPVKGSQPMEMPDVGRRSSALPRHAVQRSRPAHERLARAAFARTCVPRARCGSAFGRLSDACGIGRAGLAKRVVSSSPCPLVLQHERPTRLARVAG